MLRYLLRQLRYRSSRTLALLLGIVVATTSFSVLTGTTQTGRLQVVGTVTKSFRPAYDILVRPHGSKTALESKAGLVRQNYLSGIFGGITLKQYETVRRLPGVQVAAPIAMVGYVLQTVTVPVDLTALLGRGQRAVFRVSVDRSTDRGLSRMPDARASYVYVTRQPLQPVSGFSTSQQVFGPKEQLPSGRQVLVCPQLTSLPPATGPFDPSARQSTDCWSTRTGHGGRGFEGLPAGHVAALVNWPFPFLIAAVDPGQEAALARVDAAVVGGRYLQPGDHPVTVDTGGDTRLQVPVLISTRAYADDRDEVTVRRLTGGADAAMTRGLTPAQLNRALSATPAGPVSLRRTVHGGTAYQQLLGALSTGSASFVDNYWTVGATQYRQQGKQVLAPQPVTNPKTVWRSGFESTGYVVAPIDAADTAFRQLTPHVGSNQGQTLRLPALHAVGRFDPAKLPGFSALSAVPLETYNPPVAAPADTRTRRLLNGQQLLPNGNFAGYLESPPLLLTTLRSLPAFTNPAVFGERTTAAAPISVVRVRVAGVAGADAVSRERIRVVAQQIAQRTGLDVDVTAGSSPTPMTVQLPGGKLGRPPLALREGWVKKGVAVAILQAVDRKSLVLFLLILAVCALFVANAASAAVRSRRTELGVLSCLGWGRPKLFAAVLLEVGLVGLLAGVIGSLLALPLSSVFGLSVSLARAALAVPAAVLLALLAGVGPARRAARADPGAAVRPALLAVRHARTPRGLVGMAATNIARTPGRSLLGALSLAVGVCALTLLLAVTLAFRGELVGSLLGDAISVHVRGVDYVAAAVTVALGALAIADVLYLNIRERSGEFAVLRAIGWRERPLATLVALEGVGMGLVGSVVGASVGLLLAGAFAGRVPSPLLVTAAVAALTGPVVATLAALLPVSLLRRLPAARTLAEE